LTKSKAADRGHQKSRSGGIRRKKQVPAGSTRQKSPGILHDAAAAEHQLEAVAAQLHP
jgi:hypothetical protein